MWSWLEIIRPLNCAMAAAGVLIGGFVPAQAVTVPVLMAMLTAFLVTGAGNSINDLIDVESDRINRPKRPIPSGRMSKNAAIALTLALFGAGMLLSSMINWMCFALAALNSIVLTVYSFNLQNKVLIGNAAVAYLVGSTFLFGGAAVNNLTVPLLLMFLAGLTTFSREIVKDLEDLEGDRSSFIKKIAGRVKHSFADRFRIGDGRIKLRYRTVYAVLIASFSLWMAVVVSMVPHVWEIFGPTYLAIVIPADAVFIGSSYILIKRRNYRAASRFIKAGMILGLFAFMLGAVF